MKKTLPFVFLLLAGCASNPGEPGLWDYTKAFGELAGDAAIALASGLAENADTIVGATEAYSNARSGGSSQGEAYQAAAQSLSDSRAGSSGTGSDASLSGGGSCNRPSGKMSVGEFLMCAAKDCREQGGTRASGSNKACYGCVINGLTMWTRCHPSSGGVSSAT